MFFYDLRPVADGLLPVMVSHVDMPGLAGSAALTAVGTGPGRSYLLGVYDDGQVTFLTSTAAPLWSPDCTFEVAFKAPTGNPGPDSMALLTDRAGKVHLLSFTGTTLLDVPKEDWIYRYEVDLAARTMHRSGERHMYTRNVGDTLIHFRFGVGLFQPDQDLLEFQACDRNPSGLGVDSRIYLNTFRSTHLPAP